MNKLKKIVLAFCILLSSFLVFLIPFGAKTQGIDSRFGINAFVINRFDKQELDKPISIIKELGAGWSREEFIWEVIEPQKGDFRWNEYDNSVNILSSSNIGILGVLDYSAPWATQDPNRLGADKYIPNVIDWQNYVGKVVERYKDQVKYWQIWNEPNIEVFFKPEPNAGEYLNILKSAYEIIKQKDPSAQVVLAGTSGVDVGYLGELKDLGAGNYFDILSVHPYSFDFRSPPEENFLDNMKNAERIAEDFDNKPIWLTEFGWPTGENEGLSEELQAKYISRIYLMSYQFLKVKKLFWYDLRYDGDDKQDRENNFGLINSDYTKKQSYYAYKNLINILGDSQFVSTNIDKDDGYFDLSFMGINSQIRVIWNIKKNELVEIDNSFNRVKVFDLVGNDITSQNTNGVVTVNISDSPVFVITNK